MWQILYVSKPAHLSLHQGQLLYKPGDKKAEQEEKLTLPLEDISVIVLENHSVTLTHALLAACMSQNIVIFTCDETHTPNGAAFPFVNHSRYAQTAQIQLAASEPLKKRLWQKIIQAKLSNQAAVLNLLHKPETETLLKLANNVSSGDSENFEALGARIYWDNLFRAHVGNFTRNDNNFLNAALNYGYAVLRGCIARNLVAAGLLPSFGIHHANQLNAYNLADDLIEPFRPFIDAKVLTFNPDTHFLRPADKQALINTLNDPCRFNEQELNILKACETTIWSLVRCFKEKDSSFLLLPTFSLQKNKHLKISNFFG